MAKQRKASALPPGMHFKHGAYYLVTYDKSTKKYAWEQLGRDLIPAMTLYAQRRKVKASLSGATIADMLDDYLRAELEKAEIKRQYPTSRIKPKSDLTLRDHLKEAAKLKSVFGEMYPAELHSPYIKHYLTKRIGKNGKGGIRANREISLLSSVFEWAKEDLKWYQHISGNPCVRVSRNPECRRPFLIEPPLQTKLMEDGRISEEVRRLIRLILITGQRIGDLLNLTTEDIVKDEKGEEFLQIHQSKTKTVVRMRVTGALKSFLDERRDSALAATCNSILVNAQGAKMTYSNVQSQWQRYRKKSRAAGEPVEFTLYDLRAGAASKAADAGWSLRSIQHLLGHSNASTTDIYLKQRKISVSDPLEI